MRNDLLLSADERNHCSLILISQPVYCFYLTLKLRWGKSYLFEVKVFVVLIFLKHESCFFLEHICNGLFFFNQAKKMIYFVCWEIYKHDSFLNTSQANLVLYSFN